MNIMSTEIITASSNKAISVLNQDCKETPALLYDGAFAFFKAGTAPTAYTHLHLYTAGEEVLAIVTNLPATIGQRLAVEQIVNTFSLEPDKLLFLDRAPAAANGSGPLKRDLFTKYAFDWAWSSGMWKATKNLYCYRIAGEQETRANHLLSESARVPAGAAAVVVTQEQEVEAH